MRPPFLPRKGGSSSKQQQQQSTAVAVVSSRPPPSRPRRYFRASSSSSPTPIEAAVVEPMGSSHAPISTAPVRASVLIAGSFDDDDVRVCPKDYKTSKTETGKASPLSHRSSSLPHLSEVSRDDDDDDEYEEDSGSYHSSAIDAEEAYNRAAALNKLGASNTAGAGSGAGKAPPPEDALLKMIGALSEEEVEIAACSSYAYARMARSAQQKQDGSADRAVLLAESRHRAALQMAARHWLAEKGDAELALQKMRNTLRERPTADRIRHCLENGDEESLDIRRRVRHYLGPQCRMFVRGYDPDGRAIFHFIATNAPRNADPAEGCNESNCYVLEKAIACTERRTHGQLSSIILSADLSNFQKWQAPPLSCTREMLDVLQNHYPERMHRIYVVNAPVLFWGLWNIVKPFVDPNTKAKLQFVSSMEHAVEKDQAMPYQRADGELTRPVDVNEFFDLPFDRAYDEPMTKP